MLKVEDLNHKFGNHDVLVDVNFTLESGKVLAVLGPSGAGKSTLLDSIAGFLKPDKGNVSFDGDVLTNGKTFIPPEKRRVGLVFQSASLFPHLNLKDNISFGVKENKSEVATKWLELIGLPSMGEKFPHEISGGEQQRVAIARALAPKPRACLLDEPFSKLDAFLKKRIRQEIIEILKDQQCTSVMVTHDLDEALDVADELAVLMDGKLHHLGTCKDFNHESLPEKLRNFLPKP